MKCFLREEDILSRLDLIIKITDLDLAEKIDIKMTSEIGTPLYSAPETLKYEQYDDSMDMWSME